MEFFGLKLVTKEFNGFAFLNVTPLKILCELGNCNLYGDGAKDPNSSNSHSKSHFFVLVLRKFAQRKLRSSLLLANRKVNIKVKEFQSKSDKAIAISINDKALATHKKKKMWSCTRMFITSEISVSWKDLRSITETVAEWPLARMNSSSFQGVQFLIWHSFTAVYLIASKIGWRELKIALWTSMDEERQ